MDWAALDGINVRVMYVSFKWKLNETDKDKSCVVYEPYHLFIHVLDNSGGLVYGHDELMLDSNMRSVDKWANHTAVSLNHSLSISELPSGEYKLGVGMYDFYTGERLKITRGIFAGNDWLLLDNFILE